VKLKSEIIPGIFKGTIKRINPVIDRTTMTVKVFIHTRDSRLTDGMYLTANSDALPIKNAFKIKKDLLIGENQIYVIEDSVLVRQQVHIVDEKGDDVIINGLEDGTQILGEVWADAREGIKLPSIPQRPSPGMRTSLGVSKDESSKIRAQEKQP
jgi:hypothetical protein